MFLKAYRTSSQIKRESDKKQKWQSLQDKIEMSVKQDRGDKVQLEIFVFGHFFSYKSAITLWLLITFYFM